MFGYSSASNNPGADKAMEWSAKNPEFRDGIAASN
jgi:hypothetical protein